MAAAASDSPRPALRGEVQIFQFVSRYLQLACSPLATA